jgi:hypothetical protein
MKICIWVIASIFIVSSVHAEDTTADVTAVVKLIIIGDVHEASKAAYGIRFDTPAGTLCRFAERLFESDDLSDEEDTRLDAAIAALGRIGDEYAAKMLSQHLRWQSKAFEGNGRNRVYENYACAVAMVHIGISSLQAFADIIAESDTDQADGELEMRIARGGIQAIGRHALRGEGADPKPAVLFAKSYLEAAATLKANPKYAERLRKCAAYFAAELEKK